MTNTAAEAGREGVVAQASSEVKDAATTVQDKAGELTEQGRSKLSDTLDERTTDAGGQAKKMAQALRQSSRQMREQGEAEQAAGVAEGAADRIERLGGYLERANGDELLRDAEDFGRRRPWMVAGIGLAAGVVASRFLKASSERRYSSTKENGTTRVYGDRVPSTGASG